jgi:DNA-binding MarR family transcriptional regulator
MLVMKDPIDTYLSYAIAAAYRATQLSLAARLKAFGTQIEAWRVLEALDGDAELPMNELARIVLMNPPTLTKLVDRMVMDGLVHRKIGRADQRQVNLLLTDLGNKRMTQIREQVIEHDREILDQIGPQGAEDLRAIVKQFCAARPD